MEKEEGYQWKCEKCGKEIKSFYKFQFDYNKKLHEESCKQNDIKNI